MAVPKYDEMYNDFLITLVDGKEHDIKEIREIVAKKKKLTDEDLKELIKDLVNKKLDSRLIFMDKNISEFKKTIHPDKIADYIFQLLENN